MSLLLATIVWLLVPAENALSKNDAASPVVRGKIIHDYARITFTWPKSVLFTAQSKGNSVSITFDDKASPDFSSLLKDLTPYVTDAKTSDDGKTVILTLNQYYRIRTFITDNTSGIDLLHINRKLHDLAAQTNSPAPPKAVAFSPPKTPPIPTNLANLAPAAGEQEQKAETPPPSVPAPAPVVEMTKPDEKKAETPSVKPAETAPAPETPAEKPAEKPPETSPAKPTPATAVITPPPADDSNPVPVPQLQKKIQAEAKANPSTVKVGISAEVDSAVLRFPFAERVAAAAFIRSGTLWVVFNKPLTVDMSDFDTLPDTVIGKGVILPSQSATILRVPVNDNIYASVAKEEGSFEWAVLLTQKNVPPANPLKVEISTDPPAPANVFVSVLEMADPITVRDPQIGDDLVITPLFNVGEAIRPERDFVEFLLRNTAQGIVVIKKADDVNVSVLRNGVRISRPSGISLTPGLPDIEPDKSSDSLESNSTLFSYNTWKLSKDSSEREVTRALQHRIVEAKTSQESNEARIRLAQIYLSEGLAPEAIGVIDGVSRTNPVFYRSSKLAALRGAANFLMYRFQEAARDFSASELNNNKEVEYWRNMMSDLLGTQGQYDFLAMNTDYISKYPPIFRQRLAIVAADRSIDRKEYNVALKIFDTLHQDNLLDPIKNYVDFLLAKISADTGQEKEASDAWEKLATDFTHPFVAARAEFSLVVWGMDHDTIPKDQVIDKLERLRLAWHGDSLEMKILTLLGDLYAERKDYINAMRIWHDGVTSFPNTATAIEMGHKMEDAFVLMFNGGAADSLPTLDALTIYYQYRNYTPSGTTGTQMINHLADRLVEIDLLDQAALLLDHQMHFQVEKEQRSETGAKLATVQLLNHQPKKALQALEDSMYGENPPLLRTVRNRLTAQAESDLGQYDKALQILGQDTNPDSETIRLDVYWQQKDWPHLINIAESMLKSRKDPAAPLTLDESETVIKLALAYVFENNTVQLQYLHDYFGPPMKDSPNKPLFDFVTANDVTPTPSNFDDVIKYMARTQSFIDHYSARIHTSGLDYIIKDHTDDKDASTTKDSASKDTAATSSPKEAPKENAAAKKSDGATKN